MRRSARFICSADQKPDPDHSFRRIIRQGPWRRDDGVNRWYLYRKTVNLPATVSDANLNITVDGRYKLYVNGTRVGRGPVRCSPYFQRFDHYDVAPFLVEGENIVAVLVHVYGCDTAWYEQSRNYWQGIFGDGGLFVEGLASSDCEDIRFDTNSTWLCKESLAWCRDTPRSGWGQDFVEDFDASRMPEGWTQTNFDDSGWQAASEMHLETHEDDMAKGWGPIEPFPTLLPRDIPYLAEVAVAPLSIVNICEVIPNPELPIDRRGYEEELGEVAAVHVENAEALLKNDESVTVIRTTDSRDVVLLLKFEQLHSGYPFIEIEATGGEVIEVTVAETIAGEYLGELDKPPRIKRQTDLDCAHLFRYKARRGKQRFEKFEWTGFRYLQLTIRNAPNGIRIRHVGSTYTHYPVVNGGEFKCSDTFLNKLWELGRYTALQCTHDSWEDCPGREKRQWIGDGIVHYLIGTAAFGPSTCPIDRQFLKHGMESQRPDGLLQMFAPGDHHIDGIVIPDYSLIWICAADYYFQYNADLDLIEELFPAVQKILVWFDRQTNVEGVICDLPYWHFIEWANIDRSGISLPINAMYVGAMRGAARMAAALEMPRIADKYKAAAEGIADVLNKSHWDSNRGVYVDSVDPESGRRKRKVSQQGNAAMIYWDIAPRSRWQKIINRITDTANLRLTAVPPVVPEGEPFDPLTDVVRANTYFSHFVYEALAKARRFDLALDMMRCAYEPMLATGTTTLWESFDPSASLCHAFSATPVYQLSAHALGVKPHKPGFREFRVEPQPGDLKFATGIYPTVLGDICVSWQAGEDKFELTLVVPRGGRAEVLAPPGYASGNSASQVGAGEHHFSFNRL